MAKGVSQSDETTAKDELDRGNLMELKPKEESEAYVLDLQRKLHRWSIEGIYTLDRVHNLVYNPYVMSHAWYCLRKNKGSRTAGTDGITAKIVEAEIGIERWLTGIEKELRAKSFKPDLVRREWIAKEGKPGKLRGLGIPCLADRLVQMCVKIVLEPIFDAHFKDCSFGFRPSRGPLDAIAIMAGYMNPRFKYKWVIEADLRSCFDNIDHRRLLDLIKQRVPDRRVRGLLEAFLKAGVLEAGRVHYPVTGTPQGGIISPLLANIYLDSLDEYYQQTYHDLSPYQRDRLVESGQPIFRLIRYADDFVILVKGTKVQAEAGLSFLRDYVRDTLHMELAEEKSGVHSLWEGFDFLGYKFRRGLSLRTRKVSTILLPSKESVLRFRRKVKELTSKSTTYKSLDDILYALNNLIRGWGNYFRYGWVSRLFSKLDYYVWDRVAHWLRKKYPRRPKKKFRRQKRKYKNGTWRWINRRFCRRDITGRCRWEGECRYLTFLCRTCPPRRLPYFGKKIPAPWETPLGTQVMLASFATGHGLLSKMERLLQRH
jgi:group II intron reverse transcriptase/maturase